MKPFREVDPFIISLAFVLFVTVLGEAAESRFPTGT
jgi:hypothetical protein